MMDDGGGIQHRTAHGDLDSDMRIEDFPSDVLLYLFGYLGLDDILRLLSTCSTFRKLGHIRSLWIEILQRIEFEGSQSLACPIGEDLSQLTLSALQRVAHHTNRLDKNWSRRIPQIIGAVRVVRYKGIEGPVSILGIIPGTDLLLLCSEGSAQQLVCYDLQNTRAWPGLHFGEISLHTQYDERGKRSIALVHSTPDEQLLDIVRVEYGPGSDNRMQRLYQTSVPHDCLAVFLHAEVVGVIYTTSTASTELFMFSVNTETGVSVEIPLGIGTGFNPHDDSIFCYVLDTFICLVTRSMSSGCRVYHCNKKALPFGNTSEKPAEGRFASKFFITVRLPEESDEILSCPGLSPTGLTTVLVKYPSTYSDPTTTTLMFQPEVFTIFVQGTSRSVTIVGKARSSQPSVFLTPSGRFMVLCIDSETEVDVEEVSTKLQLVRFVRDPVSIHATPLEMPFFIDLNEIHSIAVDDHMGVVFLSHLRGFIFAVPFA